MQGTFCKVILTLMSEGMIKGQKAATTSFQDPTIPPSFGGRQANSLLWLSVRKTYGCSEGKLFVEAKGLRSVRNHLVQNLLLKSHQGLEYNWGPQWCREWTQETGWGRDNAGEMKACRLRGKLQQNQIYSRKARSVFTAARTSHITESAIFKAV